MSKQRDVVEFWLDGAQEDWEFAVEIWKSGKRLYNALFFAQLSLEKILKAYHYHNKDDHPLLIHDLAVLAQKSGLELNDELRDDLKEISSFSIKARYEDYKTKFRKKATKDFTDTWMEKTERIRSYLLNQFK
jgi:HEPN domain-containing protein